jgi:multicomponent Na+:H+ antiporter subunit E
MEGIKNRIILFVLLLGIWIALTYPIRLQEAAAGGLAALFITVLPFGKRASLGDWKLTPKSAAYSIAFLFVFLGALIKSNLDVAFRVLRTVIPVNPGIVRVKTRLNSRMGRLVLANAITLTPGTITVDTRGDIFFVHWISISGENMEERTSAVVSRFEKYLEVIFG